MPIASRWLREQQRKAYQAAVIEQACALAVQALQQLPPPKPTREIRKDAFVHQQAKDTKTAQLRGELERQGVLR
jgi:hypothetical protein